MRANLIIATCHRPELLERTLALIQQAVIPPTVEALWVIENGSQILDPARLQSLVPALPVQYRRVALAHKGAALNAVLPELSGSLLIFLDDDVEIPRDLLTHYLQAALSHGPGHFFGGPTAARFEMAPPDWMLPLLPASVRGHSYGEVSRAIRTPEFFLGFNWAAYADDLQAVGGFDPLFGPGASTGATGQETTIQWRLLAQGLSGIYLPDCRVVHLVSADRCGLAWVAERNRRNGVAEGLNGTGLPLARLLGLIPRQFLAAFVWKVRGQSIEAYRRYVRAMRFLGMAEGIVRRRLGQRPLAAPNGEPSPYRRQAG